MKAIVKKFNFLTQSLPPSSIFQQTDEERCYFCEEDSVSSLKYGTETLSKLSKIRKDTLSNIIPTDSAWKKSGRCSITQYPLNECHINQIWKRDAYALFCHNVTTVIKPLYESNLPLCDLDDWLHSAERLCKIGYDKFTDAASHIARCTNNKEELFHCYKGLHMDWMSWGLVSGARLWDCMDYEYDFTHRVVYERMMSCYHDMYSQLRQRCFYGDQVVNLIKDLRKVLFIDFESIFSHWSLNRFLQVGNGANMFHKFIKPMEFCYD